MYMVEIQTVYWYGGNKDNVTKYYPKQKIAWVSSFKFYLCEPYQHGHDW